MEIPNLAGVATKELVEHIGAGKFQASYINWSRTVNLLREHAPGWLPEIVPNDSGGWLHRAPVGAYLLIRFRNGDDVTPAVPQAVMDNRNNAIPLERITARDITDTHRRGVCLAAAFTFGLAYELWAKMPLESGFADKGEGGHPNKDEDETDVSAILNAIKSAADAQALKGHFKAAWKMLDGENQQAAKAAYDTRKAELEAA